MSDIGGLTDAILLLAEIIIAPFTVFNLKSFLLNSLFRMSARSDEKEEKEPSNQKL